MSLFQIYEELSDVDKLILCYQHKSSSDIFKTYSELLGYGEETDVARIMQDDKKLFDWFEHKLLTKVNIRICNTYGSEITPKLLRDASNEIIQRCIDWFDSLNSKGD